MSGSDWHGPFDPIHALRREVGLLIDAFGPARVWRGSRPFPAIGLYDADDHYLMRAEVPGLTSDALDLSIAGDSLTLRGERRRPEGIPEDAYRRQERPFGRWERVITLPHRVDGDRVQADFSEGVLTVILPKARDEGPRQIVILPAP